MNKLEIDYSEPEYIDCPICGAECDKRDRICDYCWYGMRMAPEQWKKELAGRGIEVERGVGCQPLGSVGFICGDPYVAKAKEGNQ